MLIRHLWKLKTVVNLLWCLIGAVLFVLGATVVKFPGDGIFAHFGKFVATLVNFNSKSGQIFRWNLGGVMHPSCHCGILTEIA